VEIDNQDYLLMFAAAFLSDTVTACINIFGQVALAGVE
jgi:hypothetical protein